MSAFKTATPNQQGLDAHKRVQYSQGLVLGVDEFNQDQLFLMERDNLHNRALHGYGTVHGLDVEYDFDNSSPLVLVQPGLAIDPFGRHICVPSIQCGNLNDWLKTEAGREAAATPGPLTIYVTLSYRECATDQVPVPGGPCRTQEESMVPSRLADDYKLSFTTTAPNQVNEQVLVAFGSLLGRIKITDASSMFETQADMVARVEDLVADSCTPAGQPSPLHDEDPLCLRTDEACEILNAMMHEWVFKVRPKLMSEGRCGNPCEGEESVLLAELRFDTLQVTNGWIVADTDGDGEPDVAVKKTNRPYQVSTRLLQEWLVCGLLAREEKQEIRTFATLLVTDSRTIRAWFHHPEKLSIESTPPVLCKINENTPAPPASISEVADNIFDFTFSDDIGHNSYIEASFDTRKWLENSALPIPLQEGLENLDYRYLDQQDHLITVYTEADLPAVNDLTDVDLETTPQSDRDILVWNDSSKKWEPDKLALKELTDVDLQTTPQSARDILAWNDNSEKWEPDKLALDELTNVDTTGASDNLVLTYQGGTWIPQQVSGGGGGGGNGITIEDVAEQLPTLPFVTISYEIYQGLLGYRVWFHLHADDDPGSDNKIELDTLTRATKAITVYRETADPQPNESPFLEKLEIDALQQVDRNIFFVYLSNQFIVGQLRFRFDLSELTYESGTQTLLDLVRNRPIKWSGHDGRSIVTALFRSTDPGNIHTELTRITNISWTHGRVTDLKLTYDSEEIFGLAVGFGRNSLQTGDIGQAYVQRTGTRSFRPGFDENSCRVTFEDNELISPGNRDKKYQMTYVRSEEIIPASPDNPLSPTPLADLSPVPDSQSTAKVAIFKIPKDIAEELQESGAKLRIQIFGEHIIDPSGFAIDATFMRSNLPSGNRPEGSPRGREGGIFESWVTVGHDLNTIDRQTLTRLAVSLGVRRNVVNEIIQFRDGLPEQRFTSIEQLGDVNSVGSKGYFLLSGRLFVRPRIRPSF